MSSSPELTSPMTIFDITEQISQSVLNLSESASPTTQVDELVSIAAENATTLIAPEASLETPMLPPERKLSVAYTASESIVSLLAIFGNALVVYIFCKNRSLRRYRNYYIVALAIADFLVGLLGIPFAILASVGLPRNLYGCLFTVSILMVLCTVSILCLVAVSIDRYWATTNPFAYYRNMTTTTAVSIILFCWVAGAIIGFLPLFGWYNREGWERYPTEYCFFTDVMDYSYLVFLYFATIVFPALLMIGFYGYIYHVVLIKIRQKGTLAPPHLRRFSEQSRTGSLSCENRSATQVLRIMVSEKRREAKAAKKLGIIVLFFMLCWMPLYTINCIQAFYPKFHVPIEVLNFTIILSHANSALNPFLYAYHLKEFRLAMKHALLSLCGKLFCGLVNAHVDKENPLGPMSRSLTMPSLGHVTTIPNPHTGKVSIKFRKIGRTEIADCRSAQISPTKQHNNKNLNSMMIPMVGNGTPSRDNLLRTAGGTDKSLTSLSLASDSSNQLLGIPLQQITTTSTTSNSSSPKTNGGYGKTHKCSSNGRTPRLHNQLSMPQLSLPATELSVSETTIGNSDTKVMDSDDSARHDKDIARAPHSESCSSLPDQIIQGNGELAAADTSDALHNGDNEQETVEEGKAADNQKDGDTETIGNGSVDNGQILHDSGTNGESGDEEEKASCGKLSPNPLSDNTQMNVDESQMNSQVDSRQRAAAAIAAESSQNSPSSSPQTTEMLKAKFLTQAKSLPEQQENNFDFLPESHRVSLDG